METFRRDNRERAEILGRQSSATREVEYEMIEETVVKSAYHLRASVAGDVVGFEYSGDVNRVVPSEIGLLKDSETEMLFYTRLVEKKLLSYRFQTQEAYQRSETQKEMVEKAQEGRF